MPLKTLFLNPPSFENFDGGAASLAGTRENESYCNPRRNFEGLLSIVPRMVGLSCGSLRVPAPGRAAPLCLSGETINTQEYEFLFSTPARPVSPPISAWRRKSKDANPKIKIGFCRPARDPVFLKGHCRLIFAFGICVRKNLITQWWNSRQGKPLKKSWVFRI